MTISSSRFELFGGRLSSDLGELKDERIKKVSSPVENSGIGNISNLTEEEFVEQGVQEIGLDIPSMEYDRLKDEESGNAGNEKLKFELPFKGNEDLLRYSPAESDVESITLSLKDSRILWWSYSLKDNTAEEIEEDVEQKLRIIQDGLTALSSELEDINREIAEELGAEYQRRVEASEKNREKISDIDVTTPDDDE